MTYLGLGLTMALGSTNAEVAYAATYEPTFVNNTFISTPATMNPAWGKGPYWPQIIDLRNFAGSPAKWFIPFSTDHSPSSTGNSGMWGYYCFDNDPSTGTWYSYEEANALGLFNSIAVRPTTNPIINQFDATQNAAGFVQMETFWVDYSPDGTLLLAYFQCSNITGSRGSQGTPRPATSPDGINWTLPSTRAVFIDNPAVGGIVGNGAATYAKWGRNPYKAFLNASTGLPWSYFLELNAGNAESPVALARYGTEDPVNGPWTIIGGAGSSDDIIIELPAGYSDRRAGVQTDPRSVVEIGTNLYSRLNGFSQPATGSDAPNSTMSEEFVEVAGPYGERFLSQAKPILGISAERLNGAPFNSLIRDPVLGKWFATFTHRTAADRNVVGFASGPLRNPVYTTRDPLVPSIWPLDINVKASLLNVAPLPTGFTGSARGTPVGLATPSSGGLGYVLQVTSGAAANSEASIFYDAGFLPLDYDMLDIWFGGVEENNASTSQRFLFCGFAGANGASMQDQTRGIYVSNYSASNNASGFGGGAGSSSTVYFHKLGSGADVAVSNTTYYGLGLATSTMPRGMRGFGVRLYPQRKEAWFLFEGKGAFAKFGDLSDFDWTQRLYPFLTARTSLNSGSTNSVTRPKYICMGGKLKS